MVINLKPKNFREKIIWIVVAAGMVVCEHAKNFIDLFSRKKN
jgi:hypothetical protein